MVIFSLWPKSPLLHALVLGSQPRGWRRLGSYQNGWLTIKMLGLSIKNAGFTKEKLETTMQKEQRMSTSKTFFSAWMKSRLDDAGGAMDYHPWSKPSGHFPLSTSQRRVQLIHCLSAGRSEPSLSVLYIKQASAVDQKLQSWLLWNYIDIQPSRLGHLMLVSFKISKRLNCIAVF